MYKAHINYSVLSIIMYSAYLSYSVLSITTYSAYLSYSVLSITMYSAYNSYSVLSITMYSAFSFLEKTIVALLVKKSAFSVPNFSALTSDSDFQFVDPATKFIVTLHIKSMNHYIMISNS